ncbi:histidine phosphatase family protein [archaeon]|nr:histidine phosphatase family protein [archaeon]
MKRVDKKNTIYLFRHGQTRFNRDGMFTGWTDSRITKKGKEDAKIAAERLKKKKFQVAIHTRLSRSKETLNIVMKGHSECTLVLEDDRMIERNYGRLNRLMHWGVVRKFGTKKYDEWHRSWDIKPPKGESFADVEVRVRDFIKDLKKFVKKNNVNVAISAHGNSIRLFRKIMEGASRKEAISWFIPYDGVLEYKI